MQEDPIRRYSEAIDELSKTTEKVRAIQDLIGEVHNALRQPYEFMVSNVDVGFPPEVAMVGDIPTLNADNWPTAKQIAEALSDLHKKRHQVEIIWHSLSNTDKNIVNPPPPK